MRAPRLLLPLALLLCSCPALRSNAPGGAPAHPARAGGGLLRALSALGGRRALRGGQQVVEEVEGGVRFHRGLGEEAHFGYEDLVEMAGYNPDDPELELNEGEGGGGDDDDDVDWHERSRQEIAAAAEREKIDNPEWSPRTTGPYKGLPDEATEHCWEIADWYLDRRGEGHKERHTETRAYKKAKKIIETGTLKKKPLGSRRQQQGANKQSTDRAIEDLYVLGCTILMGTNSGNILDLDMSDVHGRRWFKTPEGRDYLAKKERLEKYAAINETTKFYAHLMGMAPEDIDNMREVVKQHPQEFVDKVTGKPEYEFPTSSTDDSFGDRWDWGYETFANGTVHAWGPWQRRWDNKKKAPKIFRNIPMRREEWRRLY